MNNLVHSIRLSTTLAYTDFKLRNEGTWLGILWYLLDPIVLFVTIMYLRSNIISHEPEFYPVYLFIGLIVFNFFRRATMQSIRAISNAGQFIKSMTIQKEPLVVSKVLEALFTHMFEIILLVFLLVYYNIPLWNIFLYLPIVLIYLVFILGICFLLATIGVKVFDLQNLWPIGMQVLWFATPIFYSINNNVVSTGTFHSLQDLNPVYQFIAATRNALIYRQFDLNNIVYISLCALITFAVGYFIFKVKAKRFSEYV